MYGVSLQMFAIENELKKDTLLYFELDIRSEISHPVVMGGMIKKLDYSKLNLIDGKRFMSSFYEQGYFVPSLLIYDDVLEEIVRVNNDRTLLKYLGQGQKFMNFIAGNGRETKLILKSNENVFIRVTEIVGQFLHCNKEKIQLPTVSNGYENNIREIVDIYIPIEITDYIKPSRKCLKEVMHQTRKTHE